MQTPIDVNEIRFQVFDHVDRETMYVEACAGSEIVFDVSYAADKKGSGYVVFFHMNNFSIRKESLLQAIEKACVILDDRTG